MSTTHLIVRQKAATYIWVIDPSTNDTALIDRKGFGFDKQFDCRGQILRVMEIDGVKCCIGRLAIGQRVPVKNADGTLVIHEDGKQKYTYMSSTEFKWGSIYCYQPSQEGYVIHGHVDLRDYQDDSGLITGQHLYDLVGKIVSYYKNQIQPLIQPIPLFTAQDYQVWQQYRAFLQWQQMNIRELTHQ